MKIKSLALGALIVGALLPAGASSQPIPVGGGGSCGMITVTGTVTRDGTPCLRAWVTVNGYSTFTDADGKFSVTVPFTGANLDIFAQWISLSLPTQIWNASMVVGAPCGGDVDVGIIALNRVR